DLFQYGVEVADGWAGWAGFRVLFPLNEPERMDEAASFLGASYFRLLGPGHVYGLSARGIAVDTTGEREEEFPDFREFWLVRPQPGDRTLTFWGLLDGPSLTGAYRFRLAPHGHRDLDGLGNAEVSVVEVEAHLFARRDVARLGVAPLTSMFLFDENRGRDFDDVRPRVHDSDGLLMLTRSGEWIWRPLSNGPGLRVSSLRDVDPRGFGLLQRERRFDRYLDLEARYHDRPSLWVEPLDEGWGGGGVELVEIPTDSEFLDNVVAYWAPDEPFRAGEERSYRYRLVSFDHRLPEPILGPLVEELEAEVRPGRVIRYRHGWDTLPGEADPPPRSRRRFVVDFEAPQGPGGQGGATGSTSVTPPAATTPAGTLPEIRLQASAGQVEGARVEPLPERSGGWRVTFALDPGESPADMRLFLTRDGLPITETWSYLWIPDHD
ncbi:MAG: glucans biosynthesis protein, partial [Gemmatimonadales bacterium]